MSGFSITRTGRNQKESQRKGALLLLQTTLRSNTLGLAHNSDLPCGSLLESNSPTLGGGRANSAKEIYGASLVRFLTFWNQTGSPRI